MKNTNYNEDIKIAQLIIAEKDTIIKELELSGKQRYRIRISDFCIITASGLCIGFMIGYYWKRI